MANWQNKTALITGGGSGIGRALAQALAKRGALVYIADIDLSAAKRVAIECGANATALQLDVRDAAAFKALVDNIVATKQRLDFLFNNAGIGIGGEAYEIPLAAWDRIIDINIRGVVHGIAAAYPQMIKQKSGHIINTASLAGVGPAALLTPYAMTKHAVVGLSTSLRIEGKAHGVKVSVLCPAAIETPLLDSNGPADLPPPVWRPDIRGYLSKLAGKPYPAERLAEDTLKAIEKNQAVIVLPTQARVIWRLGRLFPALVEHESVNAVAAERKKRT